MSSARVWTPEASTNSSVDDVELVSRALLRADAAIAKGLPPVLTLGHLAASAGVHYFFARNLVNREPQVSPYTTFRIRKRSGGTREIAVPSYELLLLQRWINSSILSKLPVHGAAHAFCSGRGIKTMAAVHCGCRFLVKIDLRNFFGSLSEKRVYHFFATLGYTPLVAFEMARLCTYLPELENLERRRLLSRIDQESMPYVSAPLGVLPQGAPTSPALSNHLVGDVDRSLFKLAEKYSLVYSRYSDDMAFSSRGKGLGHAATRQFIRDVSRIIDGHGLSINQRKTAVQRAGCRRLVTGLLVDGTEPRLTRRFKSTLDLHLHYSEKLGLAAHAKHRGFDSAFGLFRYLQGLIAFALDVEHEWGKVARKRFQAISERDAVS